jgi:hypothetical protein
MWSPRCLSDYKSRLVHSTCVWRVAVLEDALQDYLITASADKTATVIKIGVSS